MSTNLYDLPSAQDAEKVAQERKSEAKKRFTAIKKAEAMGSVSSLTIGWNAHFLKKNGLFGILGFESENDARKAAGVGESTWYANIRLAEAFSGLDESQFTSMKQANAKKLSDLPESKRLSREWVRNAGSMSMEDFAKLVDDEMGDKAKPSDGKERATVLKMPLPVSRKKVIEEGAKEYAKAVGIEEGDIGKALELMVVEKTGQVGLVQAITNAAARVREAMALKESGLSADEALEKVYGLLGDMALEFQAALNNVSNDSSAA
jgi:hypothetical protein